MIWINRICEFCTIFVCSWNIVFCMKCTKFLFCCVRWLLV